MSRRGKPNSATSPSPLIPVSFAGQSFRLLCLGLPAHGSYLISGISSSSKNLLRLDRVYVEYCGFNILNSIALHCHIHSLGNWYLSFEATNRQKALKMNIPPIYSEKHTTHFNLHYQQLSALRKPNARAYTHIKCK